MVVEPAGCTKLETVVGQCQPNRRRRRRRRPGPMQEAVEHKGSSQIRILLEQPGGDGAQPAAELLEGAGPGLLVPADRCFDPHAWQEQVRAAAEQEHASDRRTQDPVGHHSGLMRRQPVCGLIHPQLLAGLAEQQGCAFEIELVKADLLERP